MAKILKQSNQLDKQYNLNKLGVFLSIIGLFIFLSLHIPLKAPIVTMTGFIASGLLTGQFMKKCKIIGAGLKGEKQTIKLLSELPSNYYLLQDIKVKVEGKESQLDNVVISQYGILIIETKNHNGKILGNIEDRYWTQHKISRRRNPYQKNIYNPIKQVKTHSWRLNNFLKENGIKIWINSAVYFSNEEAIIKINNLLSSSIPIFSSGQQNELLNFILEKDRRLLTEEQVNKVVKLLI